MNTPHNKRIDHIDAVRGIAALLVAFWHISQNFTQIPAVKEQGTFFYDIAYHLGFGRAGVIAFFAISGFVICPTLKGDRYEGARKFLISRCFRLYPAFWTAMILAILVKFVWPDRNIDIQQVLGNIPMLYTLFHVAPLQELYWTLEVEMVFYVLCLCLFLLGWLHKPVILFAIGMLLIPLSNWILNTPEVHQGITDSLHNAWIFLPWNLAIMFWGGLFRIWYDDRQRRFSIGSYQLPVALLVVLLLVAILARPLYLTTHWVLEGQFWALHKMIPYFLGMGLFLVGALYVKLNNRLFVWLGTISYSLYLLHEIALLIVLRLIMTRFPQFADLHLGVYLFVCLLLSMLLAGLSYQFVEKPAIRMGRNLQARTQVTMATAQ